MSSRARPLVLALRRAFFVSVVASFAGCAVEPSRLEIAPEPTELAPPAPAPGPSEVPEVVRSPSEVPRPMEVPGPREKKGPRERQGATAKTVTIDYPPLGVKVAVAYPDDGHLCVIVPETAQDPTECMGLDPAALSDALPEGPQRPFGAAYARMGDWSYIVMVAPFGSGIESREDIEEFIAGALKVDPESEGPAPKLVPQAGDRRFDLIQVKNVPVVKFRIDTPHPEGSPQYDVGTTLNYAAFGGKTAVVSFVTSPKDVDKVMPYAEATLQSLVIPPRESPERFGKPRSELEQQNTRLAITIFGPLIALGAILFLWLARSKKAEDDAAAEVKEAAKGRAARKAAARDERDDRDDEAGAAGEEGDEAEEEEGASEGEGAPEGEPSDEERSDEDEKPAK